MYIYIYIYSGSVSLLNPSHSDMTIILSSHMYIRYSNPFVIFLSLFFINAISTHFRDSLPSKIS